MRVGRGTDSAIELSRKSPRARDIEAVIQRVKKANQAREGLQERLRDIMDSGPSLAERYVRGLASGVAALVPIRVVKNWLLDVVNHMSDPLVNAEAMIRDLANDLQDSALGIKEVEAANLDEQERIQETIEQATDGEWNEEELFRYTIDQSKEKGLEIDPEVIELLRLRGNNLTQEEKDVFAKRILAGMQRRLQALKKASGHLSSVSNQILGILLIVIEEYIEFVTLRPSITAHRDSARAAISAGKGVFVAGELLLETVGVSHRALMAATDMAAVLQKHPVASAELVSRLEIADSELRQSARALQAAPVERMQLEARVKDGRAEVTGAHKVVDSAEAEETARAEREEENGSKD